MSALVIKNNEAMGWASNEKDKYVGVRLLQGEGKWFQAYEFEGHDDKKNYEVWMDQDGDSKIVELK